MIEPKFVEFETSDGLTLPGLLYEAKNSKKAVIYLHGNGSTSIFYGEGRNRDLPNELIKRDFSLLKFNNRGANIIKKLTIRKGDNEERVPFGMAYELIKDCVFDINAAVAFLKKLGYTEFYLAGSSTGANKICVYNYYKPKNDIAKCILLSSGDDTGFMYSVYGKQKFFRLLKESKDMIKKHRGGDIVKELLPDEIYTYTALYDTLNPDGNYNTFSFYEVLNNVKLTKKKLFREFESIKKPTLVIFGELDEYTYGKVPEIVGILKKIKPGFDYKIIKGADHGITGHEKELANLIANWL